MKSKLEVESIDESIVPLRKGELNDGEFVSQCTSFMGVTGVIAELDSRLTTEHVQLTNRFQEAR